MNTLATVGRNAVVLLLSQAPVAAGLYGLWPQVKSQPYLALALVAVWEALVAIAAFLRSIWKEELEKDARKACADGLRTLVSSLFNWLRNLSPGFQRKYLRYLVFEYGLFNDRGLGLINASRLDLRQVFVELRIAPCKNPDAATHDPLSREELDGNRSVWKFLRVFRKEGLGLAIIGAPGSGKTTLLHHVLLTYAENRQWRYLMRAKVPLLLYLREHTARLTATEPPSLADLAQDVVQRQLAKDSNLKLPANWFTGLLASGRCIVLLDGLDEVAEEASRKQVSAWVDAQILKYHRCRFLLTARPHGYNSAPLERAQVIEVQPFTPPQVRLFISRWYLANEIVSSGNLNTADVRARARKEADDLLRRLASVPALNDLTVNPLLLTMIAMVHRYHGALPGNRVQLYAEICQVLLERWRGAKYVPDTLRGDQKLTVLRPLAARMMERKTRELSTEEINLFIAPLLQRVGLPAEKQATFLRDLQASSGLLLEREEGKWGFAHLTFQEYLTAAQWVIEWTESRDWAALVRDTWWHETLRLFCAQSDASPVVGACLEHRETGALALLWDCTEEAKEMRPELRTKVETVLVKALDHPGTPDWKLAVETLLARRLARGFLPFSDTVQVDSQPLSHSEFQLIADELGDRQKAVAARPAHWLEENYPSGSARKPIVGLSYVAAERICAWLTQRHGGGIWTYRLPYREELTGHAAGVADAMAIWCQTADGPDLFGPSDSVQQQLHLALQRAGESWDDRWAKTTKPLLPPFPDHPTHLARDLARARREFALDSALALALAPYLDPYLDRDLDRALDLARDRALDLDLARARDRDRDLDRVLARALARDRALDLDRALDRVRGILRSTTLNPEPKPTNWLVLLISLLELCRADSHPTWQRAWNRYQATLWRLVYSGMAKRHLRYRRWRFGRNLFKRNILMLDFQTFLPVAYWRKELEYLQMDGKAPVVETLLLVRERTPV